MTASPAPIATQELRVLLVYDALPAGCISVPVTDSGLAPNLRLGEFAIIDPTDREPVAGELFLVAWTCLDRDGQEMTQLCQAYRRVFLGSDAPPSWWVGSMRNRLSPETTPRLVQARRWDVLGWSNGPYNDGILERQLRGRVVGILAPAFEEPKRLPPATGAAA